MLNNKRHLKSTARSPSSSSFLSSFVETGNKQINNNSNSNNNNNKNFWDTLWVILEQCLWIIGNLITSKFLQHITQYILVSIIILSKYHTYIEQTIIHKPKATRILNWFGLSNFTHHFESFLKWDSYL